MKVEHCSLLSIGNHFLHYNLTNPKALKEGIQQGPRFSIKRIWSETSEVIKHLKDLKDAFIIRGYQFESLDHYFERAMNVHRKILLENKEEPPSQENILLVLTFSKTLPNIKNVKHKH